MQTSTHGIPHYPHDLYRDAGRNAVRAELHSAVGADGLAAHRTLNTLAELRERADWFRSAVELYACQPLGYWYAELAVRFDQMADEIEAVADDNGIIGGAA